MQSIHSTFTASLHHKHLTIYKVKPIIQQIGIINEFTRFYLLTDSVPILIEGGELTELTNFVRDLCEKVGCETIKLNKITPEYKMFIPSQYKPNY